MNDTLLRDDGVICLQYHGGGVNFVKRICEEVKLGKYSLFYVTYVGFRFACLSFVKFRNLNSTVGTTRPVEQFVCHLWTCLVEELFGSCLWNSTQLN